MPSKETMRRQVLVRPKFVLFVLLPLVLIFGIAIYAQNRHIASLNAEMQEVNAQVLEAYGELEELKRRLAFTDSDDYIEQEARRRFGLIHEDEIRFVLEEGVGPDATMPPLPTPVPTPTPEPSPSPSASPTAGGR